MSRADKAALTKGADVIRKAERERDGTLAGVVRRIARLHGEILAAAKMSLEKAIKIGELLSRVRASRKGKWLLWLDGHVPFTRQTACNYIRCFERRDELECKNVLHLSDAYALLCRPTKATGSTQRKRRCSNEAVEQLVSKGIAKDERTAREILRKREEEAEEPEPEPEPKPKPEPDSKPELQAPKGWTPAALEESDLTDEELSVVKHAREYLTSTPRGRCEVFLRYIRENLECGRG